MLTYNDISPFKFGLNPGRGKKLPKNHRSSVPSRDEEFQAVCACFL